LPLRVIPYMDLARRTGHPQYCLYFGKKIPYMAGIVTKTLLLVFACRKAPTKSNCLTRDCILEAWAKNIFKAQNEAVGDHLSSESVFDWRSPLTTIRVFNLSREPSLRIFTLNVSMIGVMLSPFLGVSKTKVLLSTRVLNSFLMDCSHAVLTGPWGILRMSSASCGR
jgi:hypothetical protein